MSLSKSIITDEQFVKVRCSNDSQTHYLEATGAMYAHPLDDEQPVHLFNFLGVDISRCVQDKATGCWTLVSRKITLYLDPQTDSVLKNWQNPWSGETRNVLHRSYDYQEWAIPPQIQADIAPEVCAISLDFNWKKPNPLATNPKFADYSPEKYIQSADSYKYLFPTRLLTENFLKPEDSGTVSLSYYRMGPWEPWMKMKGKPGFLVLNYTGVKLDSYNALDPRLKTLIEERMPLYKEAPVGRLQRSIATSWTRFEEQFDACQRGEEFPLPAPIVEEPCLI
ncbi:hypothetical protein NIES2101_21060 [Calothrix sp. HK-06]|nr:hypothetical protein NIES2101_21060 [Calothrix sp. HK-06]